MFEQCGWSGAVLGTAGGVLAVAELLVGIHIDSGLGMLCAAVQFVAWNFVLGVHDTGWVVHYIALTLFFLSTLTFHYLVGISYPYGNPFYRKLNVVTLCLVVAFMCTFIARVASPPSMFKTCVSVSVSIEFAILVAVLVQQLSMAYGLAHCCVITLAFDTRYYDAM